MSGLHSNDQQQMRSECLRIAHTRGSVHIKDMPDTKDQARKFLELLQRFDLAMLVNECAVALVETEIDTGWNHDLVREAVVHAPVPLYEALKKLPSYDRKRIAEAIASTDPTWSSPEDICVKSSDVTDISGPAALLSELLIHREMMISVATGGDRIQDVDDYYRARQARINTSLPDDVEYDNPHDDLWDWYHYWSANLPQYKDRRQYIRQMFGPAITGISRRPSLPSEPR